MTVRTVFSVQGLPGDEIHATYIQAKRMNMQVAVALRSKLDMLQRVLGDVEHQLPAKECALLQDAVKLLAQTQFIHGEGLPDLERVRHWFKTCKRPDLAQMLDSGVIMLVLMVVRARENVVEQSDAQTDG